MTATTTEKWESTYDALWYSMKLRPERMGSAMAMAQKIIRNRERYEQVSMSTGVPWHVIGLIHARESSCDFSTHLHNGDSLKRRTVQVPKGRPVHGNPPFTWEESAIDAIKYDGLDKIRDWSKAGVIAKELEEFNGLGYASRGMSSPYLWAGSDHYTKGKFVKDGKLDRNFVDPQSGCMVVLKCMTQLDPSLDPDFKPVVVAEPLPAPNPVAVAVKSKTVQSTVLSMLMLKITEVGAVLSSGIEYALSAVPGIKSDVDQHMALIQSLAQTARLDWDTIGAWVAVGLLLYAISRHIDLKNWLHGAKEVAQ